MLPTFRIIKTVLKKSLGNILLFKARETLVLGSTGELYEVLLLQRAKVSSRVLTLTAVFNTAI